MGIIFIYKLAEKKKKEKRELDIWSSVCSQRKQGLQTIHSTNNCKNCYPSILEQLFVRWITI